jgi:hypothetical protein
MSFFVYVTVKTEFKKQFLHQITEVCLGLTNMITLKIWGTFFDSVKGVQCNFQQKFGAD